MLFNSIDFVLFFPIVFFLYWFVVNQNLKHQNIFIIIASYFFYGWWDWRFLVLLLTSTFINYEIGILLNKNSAVTRKTLLFLTVVFNIGLLVVFKYLNFFIDSFSSSFSFIGLNFSKSSLHIVLPVGISFFTFTALGYVIEVYRKNIEPSKDYITFSAFISFFPLILAGPIERANTLLPQFSKKRFFDYSKGTDGLRQILWGLFKKAVIADNCAEIANTVFSNYHNYSGSVLFLGALFYTIQIYADFSGYSEIAIGVAKLLGFEVMRNFNFPYLSLNISDFWRRWHISLSSWLRDYLFTPLSIQFRNLGTTGLVIALFITFLLCGLWHGANYTFIVWGGLHGLALGYDVITTKTRKRIRKRVNTYIYNSISWFLAFIFIVFTWIFFRSTDLVQASSYISKIFSPSLFSIPYFLNITGVPRTTILVIFFLTIEWFGRKHQYAIANLDFIKKKYLRWAIYYIIIFLILWLRFIDQKFIYFQF